MQGLTALFNQRLAYIKQRSPWYVPPDSKLLDTLTAKQTLTANELGGRLNLIQTNVNTNNNVGFTPVGPLKGAPEDNLCFTFGQGQLGWYFMYGNLGGRLPEELNTAFTFMLFRIDVAPPPVVSQTNLTPAAATLYGVVAGCGQRGGPWFTMPTTIVEGVYTCSGDVVDFKASPTPSDAMQSCSFSSRSIGTSQGSSFHISLVWLNPITKQPIRIEGTLTPTRKASYNGPSGCLACTYGIGSPYWSYTRMDVTAAVGDPVLYEKGQLKGIGWFDHQWFNSGLIYDHSTVQMTIDVYQASNPPPPTRWVWLTLQLDTGVSYMFVVFLNAPPLINDSLETSVANRYDPNGTVTYDLSGVTLIVRDLRKIGDVYFPTKYFIALASGPEAGQAYILRTDFGDGTIYLPKGTLNLESPGSVWDANEQTQLGLGFLEANQFQSDQALIEVPAIRGGLTPAQAAPFLVTKRTGKGAWVPIVLLVALIVGIILVVIVVPIIIAVSVRHKHKVTTSVTTMTPSQTTVTTSKTSVTVPQMSVTAPQITVTTSKTTV